MEKDDTNPAPQLKPVEGHDTIFEILVKGCLDEAFWQDWFGDMKVWIDEEKMETRLYGPVTDQAELYGVLSRLRNKGLALISVQQTQQ